MNWCIELYVMENGRLVNPCGTDWTMLYNDLLTVSGVVKRMRKWHPIRKMSRQVLEIRIWKYSENDKYNRDNWKIAKVISGWALIDLLNRQDANFEAQKQENE